MSLSPIEIAKFFTENGYYHARGVYSSAEIAELEVDFAVQLAFFIRSTTTFFKNSSAKFGKHRMQSLSQSSYILLSE